MKIPILDLKAQYRTIRAEIRQAIDEVLESQQFILGGTVQRFEKEVAAYLGCRHAIGVASGSDALLLSLTALGIGPGDAVVVPPFTFFSTVSSITRLGATPIFVDVDPGSCLMDAGKLEAFLEERCKPHPDGQGLIDSKSQRLVKVLLPVHLFGQCCDMAALANLAQRYRLRLVEDAAQAFGASALLSPGVTKRAGTIGDVGCFSFFPTKTLGAAGDAGLAATGQEPLAERVRMLRVHGANAKYHHQAVGLNSRLDAIQAAVLAVKLRYIDQWCEERIERADFYQRLFSESGLVGDPIIALPRSSGARSHVFNYYVIRAKRRDDLREHLRKREIQSEVYYPLPLHLQPCFASLGYRKGDFPQAELASLQVLALPMYPELRPEQQQFVVREVKNFYQR